MGGKVNNARKRYHRQKYQSKQRGIDFQLTFDEWHGWWLSHGVDKHYATKKNDPMQPCMCRYGDTGPYALSNIYFEFRKNNCAVQHPHRGNKKKIQTPAGIFESRLEAAQHYDVDQVTIGRWVKNKPQKFYYL